MMKKTVLITGASRGIGKGIALRFAKEQYNLVLTCRKNEALLLAVKEEAESLGATCMTYVGDMGDYSTVETMYQEIERTFGGVDIVINNAGISDINLFTDTTLEQWNTILQSNLSSAFFCSKLAIPYMLRQQAGKIINISSVWGSVGASMEVAYSTTKGGLNSMTKALAKELAPSNIQVNAIACGAIDTEMNQHLTEEDKEYLIAEIPADRFGTVEEVGDFAWQLATSNSYLTGQVIALDGGWI